jgi:hypothetical protein
MALPPGQRDSDAAEACGHPLGASLGKTARLAGFILLAGTSLALLGAVMLPAEYVALLQADNERDRQAAILEDLKDQIAANKRLMDALPEDPVLAKRMMMNQFGYWPEKEIVVLDPAYASREVPGQVIIKPHDRPGVKENWITQAAARVQRPGTRTLLLILSGAAMFAAIVLFGRPEPATSFDESA